MTLQRPRRLRCRPRTLRRVCRWMLLPNRRHHRPRKARVLRLVCSERALQLRTQAPQLRGRSGSAGADPPPRPNHPQPRHRKASSGRRRQKLMKRPNQPSQSHHGEWWRPSLSHRRDRMRCQRAVREFAPLHPRDRSSGHPHRQRRQHPPQPTRLATNPRSLRGAGSPRVLRRHRLHPVQREQLRRRHDLRHRRRRSPSPLRRRRAAPLVENPSPGRPIPRLRRRHLQKHPRRFKTFGAGPNQA